MTRQDASRQQSGVDRGKVGAQRSITAEAISATGVLARSPFAGIPCMPRSDRGQTIRLRPAGQMPADRCLGRSTALAGQSWRPLPKRRGRQGCCAGSGTLHDDSWNPSGWSSWYGDRRISPGSERGGDIARLTLSEHLLRLWDSFRVARDPSANDSVRLTGSTETIDRGIPVYNRPCIHLSQSGQATVTPLPSAFKPSEENLQLTESSQNSWHPILRTSYRERRAPPDGQDRTAGRASQRRHAPSAIIFPAYSILKFYGGAVCLSQF
jgi:hypothetical protein